MILLWLSHLMLTPFDLSKIASYKVAKSTPFFELPVKLPITTPMITKKLIRAALGYLSTPGKEREAAKILLARLASRPDVQKLGLQANLVTWALDELGSVRISEGNSIYGPIGRLAFLVAFAKSADDRAILGTFGTIYTSVQLVMVEGNPLHDDFTTLVLVRKLVVKLYRVIGAACYRLKMKDWQTTLGGILQHIYSSLEDSDTSVRLAASKAVGFLASQLDFETPCQLIEMIWDNLNEDFDWKYAEMRLAVPDPDYNEKTFALTKADYQLVSAQRWHGNVFSIAHMIHSFSIPHMLLFRCTLILVAALNFSQQVALKTLGDNVRDAACYGFWALARKYRTAEFLDATDDRSEEDVTLVLQSLALELVKAACFDPESNVRRAASAALQEMVGRHPDAIDHGIDLVRIIDYHAIALRSRAVIDVALETSRLGPLYLRAVVEGLLGWRGIQHHEVGVREIASKSLGYVAAVS